MEKLDKKTIILLSVLVFVLLVLGLIFSLTKKSTPDSGTPVQYQYTDEDKALPWTIALSFIKKGLVEKIQSLDPVTMRIFVKGEPGSFIVTQPSEDAYTNYISTSPNPITVVK